MPVHLSPPDAASLHPVSGVRIGVAEAGIRKAGRKDLTVMLLDEGASVGGVFTQNRFCAAPVQVCREHLAAGAGADIRALVIYTGCANAGTGAAGLEAARRTCDALAAQLGVRPQQVLPFSTGVILEPLPLERLQAGLPAALADAQPAHWLKAAEGIMTTDTVPKARSVKASVGGAPVTVTGISKGAGMIRPNMATMLGFVATDACVAPGLMPQLARALAESSFNRVTVDGDTSTNDSFIVIATNKAAHAPVQSLQSPEGQALFAALLEVARWLAQAIVRDGEGAGKFITIRVERAADREEARKVAYAVARSPLVKTAFSAGDPNLGRLLAAIGYAGIADLDVDRIRMWLGDVLVAEHGGRAESYTEEQGQAVMDEDEITVRIDLQRGKAEATVYTCDLTHEYISINADYRS